VTKTPFERERIGVTSNGKFRHELNHDVESVFWLLLYWAMVVQPENGPKQKIAATTWSGLNGNHKDRDALVRCTLIGEFPDNCIHSYYKPLEPLIKDLAAILVIDSRWLPDEDDRKDPYYITEAFQRLTLKFIIDNHHKEFMDRRVEKTFFRKVEGVQNSHGVSSSHLQSLDASNRSAMPVGCVCGPDL
jgi:hypothetical protein